jgi:hypothetical protein
VRDISNASRYMGARREKIALESKSTESVRKNRQKIYESVVEFPQYIFIEVLLIELVEKSLSEHQYA